MAHNGIIKNNMLFIAYYHDGLKSVFYISNPFNPIQTWMYDTYSPNSHASYKGAWGVYPYFQSENIVVSDMQTGLYILKLDNNTIIHKK